MSELCASTKREYIERQLKNITLRNALLLYDLLFHKILLQIFEFDTFRMPKAEPKEESGSDNEEYEVEYILSSRMTPSGRKYLVKWKNWPDDQVA